MIMKNVVWMCFVAMMLGAGSVAANATYGKSKKPGAQGATTVAGSDQSSLAESDYSVGYAEEDDVNSPALAAPQDSVAQKLQESLRAITDYTQQIQQLVDKLEAKVSGNTNATSEALDGLSYQLSDAQDELDESHNELQLNNALERNME